MFEPIPLKQLATFEAAARHLSFTQAAVELNILQPAVSRQVASLEADLGTRLFLRSKPYLTLTRDGETLLDAVSNGMSTMRQTVQMLRGDNRITPLVVNVSLGFMSYFLMPRLAGFRAAFPDCELELVTFDQYTGYNPQNSDIVLIFSDSGLPGMASTPIMQEELVAVCAPGFLDKNQSTSTANLNAMAPLFMSDALHQGDWQTFLEGTEQTITVPPRSEHFFSYMVYMQAALAGEGTIVTLSSLCTDLIASNRLVLASERRVKTDRAYYCCLNERAKDNKAAHSFISWLTDQTTD